MTREQGVAIKQDDKGQASRLFVILFDDIAVSLFSATPLLLTYKLTSLPSSPED
jgi:hypothetical protein